MQFPTDQGTQRPTTAPDTFVPGGVTMPRAEQQPTMQGFDTGPSAGEKEEQRTKDVCSKQLNELKTATLAVVKLNITVTGTAGHDYPYECSIEGGQWDSGRSWCGTTYLWKASALCHKPLYFEDEQMERYGHSCGHCLDPIVSGAHFFCKLPVLPYCMGLTPPCECIYALGHYRPGSCAPFQLDPVPLSCRAALAEAGGVVATAAIVP